MAVALRCRAVRRRERDGFALHLFGFGSDLERVELLYTSLLVQAAHGLAAAAVPPDEHPAAFRRSWLAGFAAAIVARLREVETTAGSGVELVLVDRSDRVARRMAQDYPRLRSAGRRRLAGGGQNEGAVAGRRADLGGFGRLTPPGGTRPLPGRRSG